MSRMNILLLATGRREYRAGALERLAAVYDIHLLTDHPEDWHRAYVVSVTEVRMFDVDHHLSCARRISDEYELSGVLCWDEARISLAERICRELGVLSPGELAIVRCRDKFLSRLAWQSEGVPQPGFRLCTSAVDAVEAASSLGYPVVVKPRSAAASLGVVRVDSERELLEHFAFAANSTIGGATRHDSPVIVEEYLDGEEVSVDCSVVSGRPSIRFIARKRVGFAPFFEEVGHTVDALDPLFDNSKMLNLLTDIHGALDFDTGWTHTELMIHRGDFRVIEVNARIGGDGLTDLAELALGLAPSVMAANTACGVPATSRADVRAMGSCASTVFGHSDRDGVFVRRIDVSAEDPRVGVILPVPLVKEGDELRLPPEGLFSGRVAMYQGWGSSPEESIDNATESMKYLELELTDYPEFK